MSNKITTFDQFKMLGNKVKTFVDNQISNLAGLTSTAISDLQSGKQDKLIGKEGQVVGFGSDGNVTNFNGPINQNLIDNANFKVNQRGQNSYTGSNHTIDRWRVYGDSITVDVVADGVYLRRPEGATTLFGTVVEDWERLAGKNFTVSFLSNNLYTVSFNLPDIKPSGEVYQVLHQTDVGQIVVGSWDGLDGLHIGLNHANAITHDISLRAAKLEIGDHQTLAHQDSSGNWVLNEIPNYALELAKCQRYQYVPTYGASLYGVIGIGSSPRTNMVEINVPLPVPMRTKPTVVMTGQWDLRGMGKVTHFNADNITKIQCLQISQCYASLDIDDAQLETQPYQLYQLTRDNDSTAQIIYDANL